MAKVTTVNLPLVCLNQRDLAMCLCFFGTGLWAQGHNMWPQLYQPWNHVFTKPWDWLQNCGISHLKKKKKNTWTSKSWNKICKYHCQCCGLRSRLEMSVFILQPVNDLLVDLALATKIGAFMIFQQQKLQTFQNLFVEQCLPHPLPSYCVGLLELFQILRAGLLINHNLFRSARMVSILKEWVEFYRDWLKNAKCVMFFVSSLHLIYVFIVFHCAILKYHRELRDKPPLVPLRRRMLQLPERAKLSGNFWNVQETLRCLYDV